MTNPADNTFRLPANPVVLCLILAVVTLAVFWPAKDFDFLGYDDPGYFATNPHVLTGLSADNIVWAFTNGEVANWHPVTWLSLMLDAEIFGNGAAGPHLVNLLFHSLNGVLMFLLLRRLTGAFWRSALVAALFSLHPLHLESVAWVAERKDVLCMFFELLSLLAYVCRVQEVALSESRPADTRGLVAGQRVKVSRKKYHLSLCLFALALMSKPMAVSMPFLLLLLDWWPMQRLTEVDFRNSLRVLLLEKIPFFALAALACVVTFLVQHAGGTVASMTKFTPGMRVENAVVSYARYFGKVFWPSPLANPYPHPGHWPLVDVLGAAAFLAVVSVAALRLKKSSPFFITGWLWFLGTLVPVIGLVQVGDQAMADRYSYLPVTGIFVVAVWGAAEVFAKWRRPEHLALGAAVVVLAACVVQTRSQLGYWRNDGTLFGHALAVTENNFVAEINYGAWLSKNGQVGEALEHYKRALQLKPDSAIAAFDVGNIYNKLGDWDAAALQYREALRLQPENPEALNNLGTVLMRQKKYEAAATNLTAAIKLKPGFAEALNNLGTVYFHEGQYEAALAAFGKALELAPDSLIYCANTGDALARLGRTQAAAECYQHVLQVQPDNDRVRAKLQGLNPSQNPPVPAPK
ncbi:MAG: tetratricopeptide repeat protein [Verrucomicrobia bacterium]|nr:tetratricopeptide repeat protein [Verrucomicrobiota bacterium]